MSHILVLDLPGGDDGDLIDAALEMGCRVSLLTTDPGHYRAQSKLEPLLQRISLNAACNGSNSELFNAAMRLHWEDPISAVLCLVDTRIVVASTIAHALSLPHLNPNSAALLRDKAAVRLCLAKAGIAQPSSRRVRNVVELVPAIEALRLPVVIKPTDGFGSQHVFAITTNEELAALRLAPDLAWQGRSDYGLGARARGELLIERKIDGVVLGCDTMTASGKHVLLGVNEKRFFPDSFAIAGGCFTPNLGQFSAIEQSVFAMLDAVGFDHGSAHVEVMLTDEGPQLIEINPRLVGAGIGRLISLARGRNVHKELVDLHLHQRLPAQPETLRHAVTRWLSADVSGEFHAVCLPREVPDCVAWHAIRKQPGDTISPPFENADRIGCVMAVHSDRAIAESAAESWLAGCRIEWTGQEVKAA